jgi:hypothetical protein
LTGITKQKDLKQAASVAESLGHLVDMLLADSVRSLAYALDLGDADGMTGTGVDVSTRHDFGFALSEKEGRDVAPWAAPQQLVVAGAPWHLRGSLLNLDLALAPLALKQVSVQAERPPVLTDNERDTFATTAALLNAFALRDEDQQAIVEAIDRGRVRMHALTEKGSAEGFDTLQEETMMDGWRRRAIHWSIEHDREPLSFVSLAELLKLGNPPLRRILDAWGVSAWRSDTCVCTHLDLTNEWFLMAGRPRLGLLGTQMPDLNLRVMIVLHDLGLPAALTKDVLLAAMQDFIDQAAPTDADDWLTLVRTAQGLSRERVEDYVAALTATGPLVPDDAPARSPGR